MLDTALEDFVPVNLRGQQRVVHHDRVIFGDEMFGGEAVDQARLPPPNAVVPSVAAPRLHLDEVIGLEYFKLSVGGPVRLKFAVQMFIIEPQVDLESVLRVVTELQIDVVERERCAARKGDGAIDIGKHVKAMPPTLGNRQRRV